MVSHHGCLSAWGGEAKTFSKKTYEGSRDRAYQVYIPDAVTISDPVPMVMVLHGCKQTERNMIDETGFKELADREKFVVVYPFITDSDRIQESRTGRWDSGFLSTSTKATVKSKICIRSRLKSTLNSRLAPSGVTWWACPRRGDVDAGVLAFLERTEKLTLRRARNC